MEKACYMAIRNEGTTKGIKKEKEISALRETLVLLEQNRQDAN